MNRRSSYEPMASQEAFIVPLLRTEITNELDHITTCLRQNIARRLKVLDCGCGNQPLRSCLKKHGYEYDSLDISQNDNNSVSFIGRLDANEITFAEVVNEKYDLVVATEVLEHCTDMHLALRNIFYATKENGMALVTVPFFYPLHEEPHDYNRPTIHLLRSLAIRIGFDVVNAKTVGDAVDVMGTILGGSPLRIKSPLNTLDKLHCLFLLAVQKLMLRYLLWNYERLMGSKETLYLSNILVLRKSVRLSSNSQ